MPPKISKEDKQALVDTIKHKVYVKATQHDRYFSVSLHYSLHLMKK